MPVAPPNQNCAQILPNDPSEWEGKIYLSSKPLRGTAYRVMHWWEAEKKKKKSLDHEEKFSGVTIYCRSFAYLYVSLL